MNYLCIFKIIDVYAMRIIILFFRRRNKKEERPLLSPCLCVLHSYKIVQTKLVRPFYAHCKRENKEKKIPWQQQIKQPFDDGIDDDDLPLRAYTRMNKKNMTHLHCASSNIISSSILTPGYLIVCEWSVVRAAVVKKSTLITSVSTYNA